jgi:hypothetical protein
MIIPSINISDLISINTATENPFLLSSDSADYGGPLALNV